MSRKTLPTNVARKLWAQCGGYCQNPSCVKYLFSEFDDNIVSLANVAHIIGHGKSGPRSEHELAEYIEIDGLSNLIMLCLDCHKIVDELESSFAVEEIQKWKQYHSNRIDALFKVPVMHDEREILMEINDLLDENRSIFEEYGPFSRQATEGFSGDATRLWRRRCLDTILPNNRKIVALVERNKRHFGYPWELYRQMWAYKLHADSFEDNCLLGEKINDYKLFPPEFDYFVKKSLGVPVLELDVREQEDLEFRRNTISTYINRFLAQHSFIQDMEEVNRAMFLVSLRDGRLLKVLVTNTYIFTEYTLEKVLMINPNIDAIICSNPYATYSGHAKERCVSMNIGLFSLREFMGAIPHTGDDFVNYLLLSEQQERINEFSSELSQTSLRGRFSVFLFGSFLRRKLFEDIDILIVSKPGASLTETDAAKEIIRNRFRNYKEMFDFTICSASEYDSIALDFDNRIRVL